jgi:outer membrane receptor protein involved in Fe transport
MHDLSRTRQVVVCPEHDPIDFMKIQYISKALLAAATLLALPDGAHAIKITVPDQYKDQVEATKEAERKEREKDFQSDTEAPDQVGMTVADQEKPAKGRPDDADEFLVQSVIEATDTAAAIGDSLAADEGIVSGQVVDKETGTPISGAAIILEGTDIATVTAEDGRYSLGPAPAGDYTLSFIKSGYIEANVTDYTVAGGEVSVFPFALPPRPAEMSDEVYELQDFTVTAEEANELMTKLELKLNSANVLSSLSSEDFSKFASSDIADAVKKVSGVSVVGGKYAVIRGLGDRYVSSTLNGLPIASPDPDRQAVQLDLFPSSLFSSLEVTKSFTPDQPANSTGGINLNIKPLPDEFFVSFSASVGGNSNTTGDDDFLTNNRGNSQDEYANGASGRGLPSGVDSNFEEFERLGFVANELESATTPRVPGRPINITAGRFALLREQILNEFPDLVIPDGDIAALTSGVQQVRGLADTAQAEIANSLSSVSDSRHAFRDAPGPDYSGKFSLGDSFLLSDNIKFGYVGSLNYSRKYRLIEDAEYFRSSVPAQFGNLANSLNPENFENPFLADGLEDKLLTQATETTSLSWLLGLGVEVAENHTLRLHRMNLKLAENINSRLVGDVQSDFPFSQDVPEDNLDTEISESLYYQERELISDQIIGSHRFELNGLWPEFLDIDWGIGLDEASQDEPGFVQTRGILEDDPDPNVDGDRTITLSQNSTSPGEAEEQYIIFREITEDRESGRLDFTFTRDEEGSFKTRFKFGYFTNESSRNVNDQYLTFQGLPGSGTSIPTTDDPVNDSDPFFAIDGAPIVSLNLAANVDIETDSEAKYFLIDQKIGDQLRIIFGLREESNSATVNASGGGDGGIPQVRGAGANNPFIGFPTSGGYDADDVYPGLSVIYTPNDNWSVRFAYSKTIALPSAREVAPYASSQFSGGDIDIGNASLGVSNVESADLGFTYVNDAGDSLSVTLFHKTVQDRIEKVNGLGIEPAAGIDPFDDTLALQDRFPDLFLESQNLGASLNSWYNNPNEATLTGVEFEARKQLDFLGDIFENFSIGGNYTFIDGEIERFPIEIASKEAVERPVSETRSLTDQPEDIFNVDLTYENPDLGLRVSLIYYQISEILDSTSLFDTYDVFQKGYEQLDLTASVDIYEGLKLSFSVKNLTDSERGTFYDIEGTERDRDTYKIGISYSLGASWQF